MRTEKRRARPVNDAPSVESVMTRQASNNLAERGIFHGSCRRRGGEPLDLPLLSFRPIFLLVLHRQSVHPHLAFDHAAALELLFV